MNSDMQRDLGRIDAELENMKATQEELRADVKEILAKLNEAKGGVRMLIGVGAGVGAITSAAMTYGLKVLGK